MPSFWSWLCFPNRRNGGKPKRLSSRQNSQKATCDETYSSAQKRKYVNCHHADHVRSMGNSDYNMNVSVAPQNKMAEENSSDPLVDHTSTKRRRVQDIFNLPDDKEYTQNHTSNEEENYTAYSKNMQNEFNHRNRNFGSEYTPRIYQHNMDCSPADSMYGYIPKAVQNVYASKALEGRKIDDYFENLHRNSSMTHFGDAEQAKKKQQTLVSKFSFPRAPSVASITKLDKISLLEDADDTEIEMADDETNWNPKGFDISARFESILNASFDAAWNSKEEVLY